MNGPMWVPVIIALWALLMCGVMAVITERDFRRTMQSVEIDTSTEDEDDEV